MSIVGVIPARYASSRFEGKPLADIFGKPMVQHVYERACHAETLDEVIVATDDRRIYDAVIGFGGNVQMTGECATGTERVARVAERLTCDIVVNIQGDEPLLEPAQLDLMICPFMEARLQSAPTSARARLQSAPTSARARARLQSAPTRPEPVGAVYNRAQSIEAISRPEPVGAVSNSAQDIQVTTLKQRIDTVADYRDVNIVKVVTNLRGDALYFSRAPMPGKINETALQEFPVYRHVGLYAYRRKQLLAFTKWDSTPYEKAEGLEQLRFLEHGVPIHVVETEIPLIGVDVPADLARVKQILSHE
ncbi:3-deoxy-manno-octulosonate cytidylyltransferase [Candidatus Poribacteria bacterium]|nr:MAG: 3-deoxy-manno-octulosonate cytidylyltransferase [Candidatus Poribacteria bacterium]